MSEKAASRTNNIFADRAQTTGFVFRVLFMMSPFDIGPTMQDATASDLKFF